MRRQVRDLRGKVFGKLTVPQTASYVTIKHYAWWPCVCECGGEKLVRGKELTIGKTTSCGCSSRANQQAFGQRNKLFTGARGVRADFQPNSTLYDWDRTTLADYYGQARERMAALWAANGRTPQCDLSPILEAELNHDVLEVSLNSALRQAESRGDFLVTGGLVRENLNDLDLAGR